MGLPCIQCHAQQGRYECNWNCLCFDKHVSHWSDGLMKIIWKFPNMQITYMLVPIPWPVNYLLASKRHSTCFRRWGDGGRKQCRAMSAWATWCWDDELEEATTCFQGNDFLSVCCNSSESTSLRCKYQPPGATCRVSEESLGNSSPCHQWLSRPAASPPPPLAEIGKHSPSRKHQRGESLWAESALGKEVSWSWKETHTACGSVWRSRGASPTLPSAGVAHF